MGDSHILVHDPDGIVDLSLDIRNLHHQYTAPSTILDSRSLPHYPALVPRRPEMTCLFVLLTLRLTS